MELEGLSNEELIRQFGVVMDELERREIVRSANNPIADIAETLVAVALRGKVAEDKRQKGYVLIGQHRIQVKALRKTRPGRRKLGAISTYDFDELIAVIFERDLTPRIALRMSPDVAREYASPKRRLSLTTASKPIRASPASAARTYTPPSALAPSPSGLCITSVGPGRTGRGHFLRRTPAGG